MNIASDKFSLFLNPFKINGLYHPFQMDISFPVLVLQRVYTTTEEIVDETQDRFAEDNKGGVWHNKAPPMAMWNLVVE